MDRVRMLQTIKTPFIIRTTMFFFSSSGLSIPESPFSRDPIQMPKQDPGKTPTAVAQVRVESCIEVIEKKYVIRLNRMGVNRSMTTIFQPIPTVIKLEKAGGEGLAMNTSR